MKYTHAIMIRFPTSIKFDDKKLKNKIDLGLAAKQHQDLSDTLRESGVEVIELPPEEDCPVQNLFADDIAIVINGTALLTKPKIQNKKHSTSSRVNEFITHLNVLAWQVVDSPTQLHGKQVVLEGSDVLFTGKEIFVGIRKNGTNTEGALVVAKTFADFSVIPINIGSLPLKAHVSVATNEVLVIGKDKESQNILQKIERDSTFRYKILTIDNEDAITCLNVNNRLLFRHDLNEMKFGVLQPPVELWGVTMEELVKLGVPFSRYCLLINKLSSKRNE
ncbi:hypothetical protein Mgra_00006084 [Meloidogyne graminicola]|uniref:Dimethylargininase n=1 Tax=Meloidogyne graminicola TaxID=189291 RepID=A0A8S9ZMM3_9BILA|nr:hypothetical protein Mgra_00006084 [Meloidogyne graminicola]